MGKGRAQMHTILLRLACTFSLICLETLDQFPYLFERYELLMSCCEPTMSYYELLMSLVTTLIYRVQLHSTYALALALRRKVGVL